MSSSVNTLVGDPLTHSQFQGNQSAYTNNSALTGEANQAGALGAQAQGRTAMQVAAANAGPVAQVGAPQVSQTGAGFQAGALNRLDQASQGLGPSAAQAQLAQATDANIGQQGSLALSMGGRNPALAHRQAMQGAAQIQQQAANQSAQLKAQEQQSATANLGQLAGQVQGQNLNQAQLMQQAQLANAGALNQGGQFNAGLQQQAGLANQGAQLQQGAQNNALTLGAMGLQGQLNQQAQSNLQAGNQFNAGQYNLTNENNDKAINNQANAQFGAIAGIGQAAAMSDENAKEDIKDASDGVQEFLDHLSAKSYKYTDKAKEEAPNETSEGPKTGVIAQDVERSAVGKSFTKDTPKGKMLDIGGGMGAILASLAHLNAQLKKVA